MTNVTDDDNTLTRRQRIDLALDALAALLAQNADRSHQSTDRPDLPAVPPG
jgi:hypothetical protein